MTHVTAREFNQNASAVKRAADDDIVFITDRGRPSHVLMSIASYDHLRGHGVSLYEALVMPDGDDIDFQPHRMEFRVQTPDFE